MKAHTIDGERVNNLSYALGVDIGGTKVASALINEHGNILYSSEVRSNPSDKEKMFAKVVESINNVLTISKIDRREIMGMGVGIPGKIDREKGIAIYQNNLPWNNFPIVDRLNDYFSIPNIAIDNDVYTAAFAEWKLSSLNKSDTFVYFTISTGISCSIIHEGSFLRGAGFAGEIGLLPVINPFATKGIEGLEKSASGPAIQRIAVKNLKENDMTTLNFFKEYQKGNPLAKAILKEIVRSLAHGIYAVICLLDPHKIVFGGGVINNNPYLLELVKDELKKYLIPEQLDAVNRMQLSKLKQNAGVVGAGLRGMGRNAYVEIATME